MPPQQTSDSKGVKSQARRYCTQVHTVSEPISASACAHVCVCVRLPGTRMGAQVPAQSVAAPAGVAAHRAFERLLPGVQFDVAKQVSLLGEGGPTLSAVEWPLA